MTTYREFTAHRHAEIFTLASGTYEVVVVCETYYHDNGQTEKTAHARQFETKKAAVACKKANTF